MKSAILTIDDAPVPDLGGKLDVLDRAGISAILFCTGELLEAHPDEATSAIRRGHLLANHSWDHPSFSDLPLADARDQIVRTEEQIDEAYARAGRERPARFFRFPFLDNGDGAEYLHTDWDRGRASDLQALLKELGFQRLRMPGITYRWWTAAGLDRSISVDATYDTFDWVLTEETPHEYGYHSLSSLLDRMDEDVPEGCRGINYAGSNEIVMMHAFIPIEAFAALINRLAEKRISFLTP